MIILRFRDHLDHVDTVGEDNVKIKISAWNQAQSICFKN